MKFNTTALNRKENTLRLMAENEVSRSELSKRLNMAYSLLSQYVGKNPTKAIGNDVAERISKVFNIPKIELDIDPQLLENISEKNQKKLESPSNVDKSRLEKILPILKDLTKFTEVPLFDGIEVCTEGNKSLLEKEMIKVEVDRLKERGIEAENIQAFLVDGDAMAPTIPNEARVFIDISRQTPKKDGSIYAINRGGLFLIRRIFKEPNHKIKLVCDNKDKTLYPDLIIDNLNESNDLEILGQIFHVDFYLSI